jgi:glycosyltransferase involved in cell wall biosynthesis
MDRSMISYVVAAHNSVGVIEDTVARICEKLRSLETIFEIVIVENGSTDNTYETVKSMAAETREIVVCVSEKGLGNAFRTGILLSKGDLVVATADDLPFGFSDLDYVLGLGQRPDITIGSKAHSDSKVQRNPKRTIASLGLRLMRFLVLRIKIGDTQGTFLMNGAVARQLAKECSQGGYVFTTELSFLAIRHGIQILEVPVALSDEVRPSTVRIVRDSIKMIRGMLEIRRTHGKSVQ